MRISRALEGVCMSLILLCSAPVRAQSAQPSAETAAMTDKARELYTDGTNALGKGKWGEAHATLLAAWSLKRHHQIAGNLGAAEVQLGRFREAAEHLSFYLREAPKQKVKELQKAQDLLAQARKHIGALRVKVEPAGAEVLLDGVAVGKAPLADEVFVDPGPRVIEAKLDGYGPARATVDATTGSAREVALTLVPLSKATAPAPAESSTALGTQQPAGGATSVGGARHGAEEEKRVTSRESTGASKGLIIAGAVTSAAAITGGVVFAIVSSVNASDVVSRVPDKSVPPAKQACPARAQPVLARSHRPVTWA
jgi:hypothetical protein